MPNPITNCPAGSGSINDPSNPGSNGTSTAPKPYVLPDLCVGTNDLSAYTDKLQEQYAAENLNISGAPINVFKLLGVHEQGRLIDLAGSGTALNNSDVVFEASSSIWTSNETGIDVLTTPSWIGYDFGTVKTSYGQEQNAPGAPNAQHITSIKITQPTVGARATQIRVERSTGGYKVDPLKVQSTGVGNGSIAAFTAGADSIPGMFMLVFNSGAEFTVMFISNGTEFLGTGRTGTRFNSMRGSFAVLQGTTAFEANDLFSVPVELDWYRVDIVNIPDSPGSTTLQLKQSSAARYWRIVPTQFSGVLLNSAWEVQKLELFDYSGTSIDNIQDELYLENRDRDYAKASVQFKVSYTPVNSISDLSKFGFSVADTYIFNTVFSTMVKALGRPIVIGDIIELPNEVQYDHNLKPIRKFLEVIDASWDAEGYSTSYRPIIYKFQGTHLIPSQENRDIVGTVDTQKYTTLDEVFGTGVEQISTAILTAAENISAEASLAVPEKGTNIREVQSGTNRFKVPGSYDGIDLYVEDGLPPDGIAYTEGFKLPDVSSGTDGDYFRLNYDPALNIPARLYKFNGIKNKWIYVETDRRGVNSSHKPSQQVILNSPETKSLTSKNV